MIRLIKVKDKPKFIIFENVASIMNKTLLRLCIYL